MEKLLRFPLINDPSPENENRLKDNLLDLLEVLERLQFLLSLAKTPKESGTTASCSCGCSGIETQKRNR